MNSKKRPQVYDGEWIRPIRKGYQVECCDCGLVHSFNFELIKKGNGKIIIFQAFREDKETKAIRKKKGIKVLRK